MDTYLDTAKAIVLWAIAAIVIVDVLIGIWIFAVIAYHTIRDVPTPPITPEEL